MTGAQIDDLALLGAGGVLGAVGIALLVRFPKAAAVAWLLTIAFVPVWFGRSVGPFFSVFVVVGIVAAVALLPAARQLHWSILDVALLAVLAVVAVEYVIGVIPLSAALEMFSTWAPAFLLGRLVAGVVDERWIYGAFAIVFSAVALLAGVEFLTGTNVFTAVPASNASLYEAWAPLQARGSVLRAEGAFGHSIALGGSLAIAATFTLGSRFRPWIKIGLTLLIAGATVLTFSRSAMLTCLAAIVLMCVFQRDALSRASRVVLLAVTAGAGVVALSVVRDVLLDAASEAENSALYRSDLLGLTTDMAAFGTASSYDVSTTRVVSIGQFASIDNAVLLFGLLYGFIPLVVPAAALVAGAVCILRRRATPAVIAVVSQLPAFFTVALITQFSAVVWFAGGLAVTTQLRANRLRAQADRDLGGTMGRSLLLTNEGKGS